MTIAAVLATDQPERLYAGLSVLVSSAADGEPCAALASFGALELLLDPPADSRLGRSLPELVAAALELENLSIHACAATTESLEIEHAALTERGLDGVKSTPRFLRDNAGAKLLFV